MIIRYTSPCHLKIRSPFAYVPTATKLVPQLPVCLHVTRVALGDALLSCTGKLRKFAQETLGTCYIATYSFSNQSCQPQIHQPWFMKIRGTPPRVISSNHPGLTCFFYLFTYLASSISGGYMPFLPNEFSAHGSFLFFHHHQRMCGSHHDRLTTQPDLARTVFTDQTKRDLNQEVSLGCTLETIITHRIHVCYI